MSSNKSLSTEARNVLLTPWLAEKIQRTNFSLTDFMFLALAGHSELEGIFGVSQANMDTFRQNAAQKATLMHLPFVALSPVLEDPRDWETFVDGAMDSQNVERLAREMPRVDQITSRDIYHYNQAYVQLLKDVLHMNVAAIPLLGISKELATYLKALPMARLDNAIGAIKFPLFRWRFNDANFWTEFGAGWLTEETVAHYLMSTSPVSTASLPYQHAWTDLRLERSDKEVFAHMMMAQGCRASTATNLFTLRQGQGRAIYRQIHGVSSPCGCNPTSLTWYVEQSVHRLQATTYVWLYRSALDNGGNIPEALIAANDIMAKTFGKSLVMTADRGNHLTRAMALDSRLTMAACRGCGTDYILSNGEGKIELAKDFSCPGCNYLLSPKSQVSKRKQSH
jgi:hypothetical protein